MGTQESDSRKLTPGEISLAKSVFKNSVNYSDIRIHKGSYLPFNLQNENTAMTPNGDMYFMPTHYRTDFSQAIPSYQHWFIHEMTHVWQYQLGLNVRMHGIISWAAVYHYSLAGNKLISDYNMEAQASLIADYFWLLKFGLRGFDKVSNFQGVRGPNLLKSYEWVLRGFLNNPSAKGNLP